MADPSGPRNLHELVVQEFARIEQAYENRKSTGGVPTGFHDLDAVIEGIHAGDIILVAGRPLMGKSDFLRNVAVKFAVETSRHVGIFSLRHDQPTICRRMLAAESGIPMHRMVRRLITRDWPRLVRTTGLLAGLPILVEAGTAGTERQLLDFIEALDGDPGLVVVDGLELMTSAEKHPSRRAEAGTLIRLLRDVAGEKQAAVIASLTTRPRGEPRPDNRPVIDDLGEWESLAADAANMVLFLHRPEAYLVYTPAKGIAEVIVAKNNYGGTATVKLVYRHNRCRFDNLAEGYEEHIPSEDRE